MYGFRCVRFKGLMRKCDNEGYKFTRVNDKSVLVVNKVFRTF
jgi:hypothetical protein